MNHFKGICKSVPRQGKQTVWKHRGRPVHEMQHNDKVIWHNSCEEEDKQIGAASIV